MSCTVQATLKVGTRASVLAVWQAEKVISALSEIAPDQDTEMVKISTSGDVNQQGSLADIGGKGLFSKEIDRALIEGEIDFAVHSLKDLETTLPKGISLVAVLARDDARDAFLGQPIDQLQAGARVGTCSVRRAAQILKSRPDLQIVPMRGSVQTRIQKLEQGHAEATLLSYAGLLRLGLQDTVAEVFAVDDMIPAVGQGVIAICARTDDAKLCSLLAQLNHTETDYAITAERALLAELDGSCHTPIGGHATMHQGILSLSAILLDLHGQRSFAHQDQCLLDPINPKLTAQKLAVQIAAVIKDKAASILASTQNL